MQIRFFEEPRRNSHDAKSLLIEEKSSNNSVDEAELERKQSPVEMESRFLSQQEIVTRLHEIRNGSYRVSPRFIYRAIGPLITESWKAGVVTSILTVATVLLAHTAHHFLLACVLLAATYCFLVFCNSLRWGLQRLWNDAFLHLSNEDKEFLFEQRILSEQDNGITLTQFRHLIEIQIKRTPLMEVMGPTVMITRNREEMPPLADIVGGYLRDEDGEETNDSNNFTDLVSMRR